MQGRCFLLRAQSGVKRALREDFLVLLFPAAWLFENAYLSACIFYIPVLSMCFYSEVFTAGTLILQRLPLPG